MKEKSESRRILFVGLNTVDLQFYVNHYPESNTKTKADYNEVLVGGPATNAAITCAYLGSKVDLFTPIGKHPFAAFIRDEIARFSVGIIDPVAGFEGHPVFATIITSQHNGDRTIFSYHPDNKYKINNYLNFNLSNYSLILFDGFHPELTLDLAKKAKGLNISTVLDGGSWKSGFDRLLKYIDIAICSNDFHLPDTRHAEDVFEALENNGIKYSAITRGEQAVLYREKKGAGEIPVTKVQVMDTLGAGDIFHGAFCHYYNDSGLFRQSLEKAVAIATESCKSRGTRAWMRL